MASRHPRPDPTPDGAVRRNIFLQHTSRRPTTSSVSISSTSASITVLSAPEENSGSIVATDDNGNYRMRIPDTEALMETPEENAHPEPPPQDDSLIEPVTLVAPTGRDKETSDPEDLFAEVQAALRYHVASLQDDDWMYECKEIQ